jgi:cellulose synthase/poly-beta-1,6-N-acetylglucosamine synthase-like glycosyltransferase
VSHRRQIIPPRTLHLEKVLGILILLEIWVIFVYYPVITEVMFVIFIVLMALYLVRAYGVVIFSQEVPHKAPPLPEGDLLPRLSVIIPLHNEELVVAATLRKMAALRYPDDLFMLIFVLDNCTDQTEARLEATIHELGYMLSYSRMTPNTEISTLRRFKHPQGRNIQVVSRDELIGGRGKSSALNAAFMVNDAEIIGIYDADHRPEVDNALIAARWFSAEPQAGCVQGPCYILNGTKNILTRLIFFEYLSLNRVDQPAKSFYNGMVCFEGANGYFRREAIERSGEFDLNNLAEDTYLSFKLAEFGYHIRFDPEIRSYEQSPETLRAWYSQRLRWARGWFQCTRHKIFRVGRLNWIQKIEGEYLLLSGLQSIVIMLFLLLFPLYEFYLVLSYLFGYNPGLSSQQNDLFIMFHSVIPFFFALAIITPLLQAVIGSVFLSNERPLFMAKNRSSFWALLFFPIYSIMQGVVALFAFIEEFILHKPLVWVKTPRSQQDMLREGFGQTPSFPAHKLLHQDNEDPGRSHPPSTR